MHGRGGSDGWWGAERIRVGHGLLKGERVMLIKADIGGYKYYSGKGRKAMILSQAVLKVLSDAGLKKGYYRPKKIKGGWMGGCGTVHAAGGLRPTETQIRGGRCGTIC